MSFPFLEAWRCIRVLMDRGHLLAAVFTGLPRLIALRIYEGKLIERICEADAKRTADRNAETDFTRQNSLDASLTRLRAGMLERKPSATALSLIQTLEKSQKAGTVLAVLCTMFLREGLIVDAITPKPRSNAKSNFPPRESKPHLTLQRPDAWRRRLVNQFPELAKDIELFLEAMSDKPVPRSARRITRDQRDTRRPDRR